MHSNNEAVKEVYHHKLANTAITDQGTLKENHENPKFAFPGDEPLNLEWMSNFFELDESWFCFS